MQGKGTHRAVLPDCTSMIVLHKVASVRYANLIVVLDHCRVIKRGTHTELPALGGFHAAG